MRLTIRLAFASDPTTDQTRPTISLWPSSGWKGKRLKTPIAMLSNASASAPTLTGPGTDSSTGTVSASANANDASGPPRAEVCCGAKAHQFDLLRPDSGKFPRDAHMAKLVDDQRDDAADAAEERQRQQDGRLRIAAEDDEEEREHAERNQATAARDDWDWPLDKHKASLWRYLKRDDSKHVNCIDRSPRFLEIAHALRPGDGKRENRRS